MTRQSKLGTLVLALGVLFGGLAAASPAGYPPGLPAQNSSEAARNTGYRDGLGKGSNDARQAKSYSLDRHDYYRDANHGYRSSYGNREQYKQQYREGFQRGYEEGYRGVPERGRRRDGIFDRQEERWRGADSSQAAQVAQNTGYRDGLEKGRNDGAGGQSYRLDRHDAYAAADHGYLDSFGNREQYRQQYREGFQRGYEEGYRGRAVRGGRPPGREYEWGRGERPDLPANSVQPASAGSDVAENTGHRDGMEKGSNDARQGKSFNLDRHDYFRNADHGYRNNFGNRDA